jgi:hypothetical protein
MTTRFILHRMVVVVTVEIPMLGNQKGTFLSFSFPPSIPSRLITHPLFSLLPHSLIPITQNKNKRFCTHHLPKTDESYENNPNRLKVLGIAQTVIGVVVNQLRDTLQLALVASEKRRTLPDFEEQKINRVSQWIRKACSLGEDLRRIDCDQISGARPLESTHSGRTWIETSFLQGLLRLCCILPRPLGITNMLLDLLYDLTFKVQFAKQFVRMYNLLFLHSIDPTKGKRLRNTLSTISAQLFNIEELMILLVKDEGLLESMLYCSANFFRQMLTVRLDPTTAEPKPKRRHSDPSFSTSSSSSSSQELIFSPPPLRHVQSPTLFQLPQLPPPPPPPPPSPPTTQPSPSLLTFSVEDAEVPELEEEGEEEEEEDDEYDESGDDIEPNLHDNFPETTGPFASGVMRLAEIDVLKYYSEEDLVFNCTDVLTDNDGMHRLFYDIQLTLRYSRVVEFFLWERGDIFARCLRLLRLMQGMNPNIRQILTHVEFESTSYQHALFLDARITSQLIEPTIEGYSSVLHRINDSSPSPSSSSFGEREDVTGQILEKALPVITMAAQALLSWLQYCNFVFTKVNIFDETYPVIEIEKDAISYHLPLHRMVASVVQVIAAFDFENVSFKDLVPAALMEERNLLGMLQQLLQIHVLNAQIRAGHWIRNGEQCMYLQRHYYTTNMLLFYQHQMDIFLIQLSAANLRPNLFVTALLHQFQLEHWFVFSDRARLPSVEISEERYVSFAEDMLRFILVVLLDRSNSADINWIRKQTIAWLCVNEWTFTELSRKVTSLHDLHFHSLLEAVLKEVATPEGRGGKFKLRKELWCEFNPYFLHYSEEHVQQAMERFQQLFPSSPNPPPPFTPTYTMLRDLENVLDSKLLHSILLCVLYNVATESTRSSESLLDSSLHLLYMAINKTQALKVEEEEEEEMDIDLGTSHQSSRDPLLRIDTIYDVKLSFGSSSTFSSSSSSSASLVRGVLQEFNINGSTESIISLLFKISKLKKNRKEPVNAILQLIGGKHPRCKEEIDKLQPPEISDEEAKLEARKRRQQILAQFTAKQQSFSASLESGGEYDDEEEGGADEEKIDLSNYRECAICREMSCLSGLRPMGLAALCQRSRMPSVIKERENDRSRRSSSSPETGNIAFGGEEEEDLLMSFKSSSGDSSSQSSPFLRFILNILNSFSTREGGQAQTRNNTVSLSIPSSPHYPTAVSHDSVLPPSNPPAPSTSAFASFASSPSSSSSLPPPSSSSSFCSSSSSSSSSTVDVKGNKLYQSSDEGIGININSCGHFAHFDCLQHFIDSRSRRQEFMQPQGEALLNKTEREWFWCPVCRQLSNVLIPLVPSDLISSERSLLDFQSWINDLQVGRSTSSSRPIGLQGNSATPTEPHPSLGTSLRRFANQIVALAKNTPLSQSFTSSEGTDQEETVISLLRCLIFNLSNLEIGLRGIDEENWSTLPSALIKSTSTSSSTLTTVPAALLRASCAFVRFCTPKSTSDKLNQALLGSILSSRTPSPSSLSSFASSSSSSSLPSPLRNNSLLDVISMDSNDNNNNSRPLLSMDLFDILVKWLLVRSEAIPPIDEVYLAVRLCFAANVVQSLLSLSSSRSSCASTTGPSASLSISSADWDPSGSVSALRQWLESFFSLPPLKSGVAPWSTMHDLKVLCLPFLRRAALLLFTCWQLPPPQHEQTGMDYNTDDEATAGPGKGKEESEAPSDEFEVLLQYLKIPSVGEAILLPEIKEMITTWCKDLKSNSRDFQPLSLNPPKQFGLVPLPTLFQDLFHSTNGAKCKHCETSPDAPAMCLVCGEIICAYKATCCTLSGMGECFRVRSFLFPSLPSPC